jgi:hypothetical protein
LAFCLVLLNNERYSIEIQNINFNSSKIYIPECKLFLSLAVEFTISNVVCWHWAVIQRYNVTTQQDKRIGVVSGERRFDWLGSAWRQDHSQLVT